MITAIVNFKLPADIDARKAAELFKGSAPKYRGMKGLVRKYYLFDAKSRIGGGVYLWKTRADAEAVYTPQWQDYIADRYGTATLRRLYERACGLGHRDVETAVTETLGAGLGEVLADWRRWLSEIA